MGVYIKGMEMPKSCWECEVGQASQLDNNTCPFYAMEGQEQENYQNKIAEGCPIVEVSDDKIVLTRDEFRFYSRCMLIALELRDLLAGIKLFEEKLNPNGIKGNAQAVNKEEE